MLIDDDYAERVARLLHEGRLVLFVGAGLSLQARSKSVASKRMPLWSELAQRVAEDCGANIDDFKGDILDLFDSIAASQSRRDLEDAIRRNLPDDQFEPGSAHAALAKLPWERVYTTNYDDFLKRALSERLPVINERNVELFNRPKNQQPKLVHLHGDLSEPHTLTSDDYTSWKDKHRGVLNKFVVDATECSILFVGYSNSDPHFRFQVLPLIKTLKASRGHPNFSWMWQPTDAQTRLYQQRDQVEVHPIEEDAEWERCFDILVDAYQHVKNDKRQASTRKIRSRRFESSTEQEQSVFINGYKLFYHRDYRSISREKLARRARISVSRIRALETVDRKQDYGEKCFKRASPYEIWNLERALRPQTSLEYGRGEDDFLAFYLDYYKNNWKQKRAKNSNQQDALFSETRAVVFDFGGTLTVPKFKENTWERIWRSAGYDLQVAHELHHQFSTGKITHQEWCDLTCDKLRAGGFSRDAFKRLYSEVEVVDGIEETFSVLRNRNVQIHIVSGSLRDIIENALGPAARYIDSIRSNDFVFGSTGELERIVGHPYDFEGKAHFITKLASDIPCHPIEILFVGNSLNDEKAATSGARTLCVNPKHTHHYVESMWNNTIREMHDLRDVLRFV